MPKEKIELREGLPGYWRHNPAEGPHWWGVQVNGDEPDSFCVREYHDGEIFPVQEDVVNSLSAAKDWIRDRKRAKSRS